MFMDNCEMMMEEECHKDYDRYSSGLDMSCEM
jgi:hypothetical protein